MSSSESEYEEYEEEIEEIEEVEEVDNAAPPGHTSLPVMHRPPETSTSTTTAATTTGAATRSKSPAPRIPPQASSTAIKSAATSKGAVAGPLAPLSSSNNSTATTSRTATTASSPVVPTTSANANAKGAAASSAKRGNGQQPPISSAASSSSGEYEEVIVYEEIEEEELVEDGYDSDDGYDYDEAAEVPLKHTTFGLACLGDQTITAFKATDRLLFVGTNQGQLFVLDLEGNRVQTIVVGQFPIEDICPDHRNDFCAACDSVGNYVVQNMTDTDDCLRKNSSDPIRCIAIHPNYSQLDERPILFGFSSRLALSTKGRYLGNRSTKVLEEGSRIHSIAWSSNNTIAYASGDTIKLMDHRSNVVFASFQKPVTRAKPNGYRCCLVWESVSHLLVAWGDWVVNLQIENRAVDALLSGEIRTPLTAREVSGFQTYNATVGTDSYRVCGIAPFGTKLLLLNCVLRNGEEGSVDHVDVRLVDRLTGRPAFIGDQKLVPRHPTQFLLGFAVGLSADEMDYYIVAPDGIIRTRPCDNDDHVMFLLSRRQFQQAFDAARNGGLRRQSAAEIGKLLTDHLLQTQQWELLAKYVPHLCGLSQASEDQWVEMVRLFETHGRTHLIAPYLPRHQGGVLTAGPRLSPRVYEQVLNACLFNDLTMMRTYIAAFDGLYEYDPISHETEKRYAAVVFAKDKGLPHNAWELVTLADIYSTLLGKQQRFADALEVLMRIDTVENVFAFIRENKLYAKAAEMLPKLFAKDEELTLKLLMEHVHNTTNDVDPLAPEPVVRRLENDRRSLWRYIRKLGTSGYTSTYTQTARTHAQLFAELLVEMDPPSLLPFFREMSAFLTDTKTLLERCREAGLLEAQAYLMTRMGHTDEGLKILVVEMKNVKKALDVIKDFSSDEDQVYLFKKIVALVKKVMENQRMLQGKDGYRYFHHQLSHDDTWERVAERYGIDPEALRLENGVRAKEATMPSHGSIKVPMNMLANLFKAVSDPSFSDNTAIDPIMLIEELPPNQNIPDVAASLSRIATSKARYRNVMHTLMHVLSSDIVAMRRSVQRLRTRAIRQQGSGNTRCDFCSQLCVGSDMVVFACGHTYHPSCVIHYLLQSDAIRSEWIIKKIEDPMDFLRDPRAFLKVEPKKQVPHCRECPPVVNSNELI